MADDLEILKHDGYMEARFLGSYSIRCYLSQMERSAEACLAAGLRRLLVDFTDLDGYRPTTADRHKIGVQGAALSRDLSKVAVLMSTRQDDPDRFITRVARNRGLTVQAFVDRAQAVEWLLAAAQENL
jgi:hypothetical protein